MNLPVIGKWIDERFLMHRLRSSSLAGITGGIAAIGLFEYRLFVNHVWSWDVLGIAVTMATVKLAAMIWYRIKD